MDSESHSIPMESETEKSLPSNILIGKNIIELRQHYKMSQRDFALKMGISKATVSLWENGKKYPTRRNLEKLSSMFNLNPQDLFGQDLLKNLALQPQFTFKPAVFSVKQGVELHIETEKLSREELSSVEKAIKLLKVFFSPDF